mmetsp:Transcript_14498/g.29302  ORF Transcript_14498/g.29302 Transcript_14498/m.29302 type:complete len:84 (+) Transcript_14498:907-1158(+)
MRKSGLDLGVFARMLHLEILVQDEEYSSSVPDISATNVSSPHREDTAKPLGSASNKHMTVPGQPFCTIWNSSVQSGRPQSQGQ